MQCKSLWLKATAKCINVNVNKRSLKLCFGPLWFGTVSVKQTKTENTIWLNPFIKSVFAPCFEAHTSFRQSAREPVFSAAPFTVNECSELVYCMCCEFSALWEYNGHQLCFIFVADDYSISLNL